MPPTAKALAKVKGGYCRDLQEGWKYVWRHDYIKGLILFYALFCIFISPISFLSPIFIARNFGSDVIYLTIQEVVFSSGSVLGGLVLSSLGNFKNKGVAIGLSTLTFSVLCMLLGFSPYLVVFYAITAVIGFIMPWCNTSVVVILQERVDPNILGRVFSLVSLVGAATAPLGMLIFGPLADIVNIVWIFLGSGLCMFIVGLWFLRKRRIYEPSAYNNNN